MVMWFKSWVLRMPKAIDVPVGTIFGRLQVICELPPRILKGNRLRMFLTKCTCGEFRKNLLLSLRAGDSQSCGCLNREITTKSGKSSHKLMQHHVDMCRRADSRDNCEVVQEWRDFHNLNFYNWALANGWKDGLVLCRKRDKGDYSPDNVRWDTQLNNIREAHCRNWVVTTPCGDTVEVYNLSAYCKEHRLSNSHMSSIANGKRKTHKGYKVFEVKT